MKVLALNSSPRGEGQSKTRIMLSHLVRGMAQAGADVEVVHLREKKIKNCIGCFTCWTKTPGVCVHQDDMTKELYPKWLKADLVVYATPLYHFTVNASMKAFIERTLPVIQPFLEEKGGRTYHPLRHPFPKAVFVSVAGFPEQAVFDQMSTWVRFIYGSGGMLVAEIYRPAAESMILPAFRDQARDIYAATEQAGREIVESMNVSPETMARVTRDLTGGKRQDMFTMANLFWKTCIEEGVTPKEFEERGLKPRPDSLETFMTTLPMGFNPDGAGDTRATIQFRFSGEVQGTCHFVIQEGRIEPHEGDARAPDLVIDAPFEVWMDIMTGKADGQQMFMEEKYKVEGDLSLLLRMKDLFAR